MGQEEIDRLFVIVTLFGDWKMTKLQKSDFAIHTYIHTYYHNQPKLAYVSSLLDPSIFSPFACNPVL